MSVVRFVGNRFNSPKKIRNWFLLAAAASVVGITATAPRLDREFDVKDSSRPNQLHSCGNAGTPTVTTILLRGAAVIANQFVTQEGMLKQASPARNAACKLG